MSSYFDENHIQQILQTVNIVEVVGNYVALRRRGKEMVGLCPFHNDSRPSMNVSESKQIFKCFACGAGGTVITFIQMRENMSFPEAVIFLAEKAGIKLPQRKREFDKSFNKNELEEINKWAARYFRSNFDDETKGEKARQYVQERKINNEIAKRFGIGWAPDGWDNLLNAAQKAGISLSALKELGLLVERDQGGYYDRFRERIIFPVIDALGRIIGFGGRTLGNDPAKYLNSPECVLFNKSRALYGMHAAKDSIIKARQAIVVEGYTDCIMAHQYGLTNVVATLGTALTLEHAQILSRYTDSIVLVFDSDMAGQKAADRAIEQFFAQKMEVSIVTLPDNSDPCDFLLENGAEALEKLAREATPALEYKWKTMKRQIEQGDSINAHQQAVDQYLQVISQLVGQENIDSINLGYMLNRVAKLIDVSSQQVLRKINQQARRKRWNTTATKNEGAYVDDSEKSSQKEVMEVLINKPECFEEIKKNIEPEDFIDPQMRQVAARIWQYCDKTENINNFSLVAILAGCESPELCRMITELEQSGARRGNFEHTLEGALNNIRKLKSDKSQETLKGKIRQARDQYGQDAQAALMLEIQAKHKPDPRRANSLLKR
ncbi:MAG: DNA primase [Sedimentisphaerales bacterium]|nr:DNA primase [Sedimentisphaerales bacterium]